jgi:hypothetical protein
MMSGLNNPSRLSAHTALVLTGAIVLAGSNGLAASAVGQGSHSAAGIRSITQGAEAPFDRFWLSVEFVSAERDGAYVTFRVRVPQADVDRIRALGPGTWITETSPHRSTDRDGAVIAMRGYNDVS